MVLSNSVIFTNLGFTAANIRNSLITDFLSGGLDGLEHISMDDVRDACNSYAKRTDGIFPIILTTLQKQRMKALALWVQDMKRAQLPAEFPNGTTAAQMIAELNDSLERHKTRSEQKKIGESYHDHSFNNKLRSQNHFEKFYEELESTLSMIIGSQGIPLSCIICEDETSAYDDTIPYEEAVIQAASLAGPKFDIDKQTVHQLILLNVHEDSDAYTYIKPLIRRRDGRQDMEALRGRYKNDASQQTIINEAKASLKTLRFKNERSFSFERFSAKFTKAYEDLSLNGRGAHNGDIVDSLWPMIQDPGLKDYIASLKVDYRCNP